MAGDAITRPGLVQGRAVVQAAGARRILVATSDGLLTSDDTAVTQQGHFFNTQEFPTAPSTVQQSPFPPAENPYLPTQEQNPYSR